MLEVIILSIGCLRQYHLVSLTDFHLILTATWRIITLTKWLITMVSKSCNWGCGTPSKWPKRLGYTQLIAVTSNHVGLYEKRLSINH